jgi:hypothetical protein
VTHRLAFLPLLALCACQTTDGAHDTTGDPIDPLGGDGVGELELDADELQFGTVNLGSSGEASVLLSNIGDGDLSIEALAISPEDAFFTVDPLQGLVLPAGQSVELGVHYTPLDVGPETGWLRIEADIPDTWSHTVFLEGRGTGPRLVFEPEGVGIDDAQPGCDHPLEINLANRGDQALTIESLGWLADSDELWLEEPPALPWELHPGELLNLLAHYRPIGQGEDQASLEVESSDPLAPLQWLALEAACPEVIEVEQRFVWRGEVGTDVILAMDSSASMQMELGEIREQLADTQQALADAGVDFQLGLVYTDSGCVQGSTPWLDPSHSREDALAALIEMSTIEEAASNAERAFMQLEAALAQTGTGGCNEGLRREGYQLQLVGISDEPEQSVNTWAYYTTLFQSYAGDPDEVTVHAVGGDYPGGCDGASAYTGMYEATVSTGGELVSICSGSWGMELATAIAAHQGGDHVLPLDHHPVPESIELWVDGERRSEGWSYSEAGVHIAFDEGQEPPDGAEIDLAYIALGDCGGR